MIPLTCAAFYAHGKFRELRKNPAVLSIWLSCSSMYAVCLSVTVHSLAKCLQCVTVAVTFAIVIAVVYIA